MLLDDGRVIEIQIRTRGMHDLAESGTASHEAYRAQQLGGGLALRPSAVQRTSLALRGVQKVARDASESVTPVRVPLLPAASSAVVASVHDVPAWFEDERVVLEEEPTGGGAVGCRGTAVGR